MRADRHDDEPERAAVRLGAQRRPPQAHGRYFDGLRGSCARGAAYEWTYRLPAETDALRPRHLERLFDCLENTTEWIAGAQGPAAAAPGRGLS